MPAIPGRGSRACAVASETFAREPAPDLGDRSGQHRRASCCSTKMLTRRAEARKARDARSRCASHDFGGESDGRARRLSARRGHDDERVRRGCLRLPSRTRVPELPADPPSTSLQNVARSVAAGARDRLARSERSTVSRSRAAAARRVQLTDESQFPHLLRAIARDVPDLLRLRYTSPHPRHATPSLANAHRRISTSSRDTSIFPFNLKHAMLRKMIRSAQHACRPIINAQTGLVNLCDPGLRDVDRHHRGDLPGETDDFQFAALVREVGVHVALRVHILQLPPRPR